MGNDEVAVMRGRNNAAIAQAATPAANRITGSAGAQFPDLLLFVTQASGDVGGQPQVQASRGNANVLALRIITYI